MTLPTTVMAAYSLAFDKMPDLLVRAPGRINLIGEHTDYNSGLVLPAAIDRAIWLAMGRRDDNLLKFKALDLNDCFQCALPSQGDSSLEKSGKGWPDYLLGVVSVALADGCHLGGFNAVFSGDIPWGAGLSSSAALECGTLFGLNGLFGLGLSPLGIVRLAQLGENRFVGMNCGIMDMYASVMGRAGQVFRLDCRSLEVEYLPFEAPGLALVLCDSGVKHSLVDSEYNARRAECEEGLRLLQAVAPEAQSLRDVSLELLLREKGRLPEVIFRRCRYVVEETSRVEAACNALKIKDFTAFGKLLNETHAGLRDAYEVTCPQTDSLVAEAQRNPSVLGARQMGGGFGGCTLNLVREGQVPLFAEGMQLFYKEKWARALACHVVSLTDGVAFCDVGGVNFTS